MRLSCLAAFGLLLLSLPVAAQQPLGGKGAAYGSYTCMKQIPCADDYDISSERWAAIGNACITHAFGYTNPDGFFDDTAGLDGSDCLTAIPKSIPNYVGSQLTPVCCVIKTTNNACAMHCDLVVQ